MSEMEEAEGKVQFNCTKARKAGDRGEGSWRIKRTRFLSQTSGVDECRVLDGQAIIRQALMGHSHIRTTEAYLHSTDDRKVEAIESLQFGV